MKNKELIATIIRRIWILGAFIMGVCYSLFEREFAELHVLLPGLNLPVFVGEIFLGVSLLWWVGFRMVSGKKFQRWHIILAVYLVWLLTKAFIGYSQGGNYAFRIAALFYYPFFAVIGYDLFDRKLFQSQRTLWGMLLVLLGYIYAVKHVLLLSYYQYLYLIIPIVLILRLRQKWLQFFLIAFVIGMFPWDVYLGGARGRLVSFVVSILFVVAYFAATGLKKFGRYKFLIVLALVGIIAGGVGKWASPTKLKSLYRFDELKVLYEQYEGLIAERSKDFAFVEIIPKLYAKETMQISETELERYIDSSLHPPKTMGRLEDQGRCIQFANHKSIELRGRQAAQSVPGKRNYALLFDGNEVCADFDLLREIVKFDKVGSICFWVKLQDDSQKQFLYYLGSRPGEISHLQILFSPANKQIVAELVQDPKKQWQCQLATPIVAEKWYHYCLVQDGKFPKVYLNGKRDAECSVRGNPRLWHWDLREQQNEGRIGCLNTGKEGFQYHLNGALDEFRYYQRALTESEISALAEISEQNIDTITEEKQGDDLPCSWITFDTDVASLNFEDPILEEQDQLIQAKLNQELPNIIDKHFNIIKVRGEDVVRQSNLLITKKEMGFGDARIWAQGQVEGDIRGIVEGILKDVEILLKKKGIQSLAEADQLGIIQLEGFLENVEGNLRALISLYFNREITSLEALPIDVDYGNILFRLYIWGDMFEGLLQQKALGGISFGKAFRSKRVEMVGWAAEEWKRDGWIDTHNSFVHIIYRAGIVGIALIGILLFFFSRMIKCFIKNRSLRGVLLSSILINFMVSTSFLSLLELPYTAITFWILFGMALAYAHQLGKSDEEKKASA